MSIYDKLYPYQKKIVDKFKSRDSFGLFLDMGLGKTPLSLAFSEVNNCTKIIIITINSKAIEPVSLGGSWLNWLTQSSINYNLYSKVSKKVLFDVNMNDVYLINYESLFERGSNKKQKITLKKEIQDFIASCKAHNVAIIVDESHKMKNLQSLQTGAIMQIKKLLDLKATKVYTYLLTGTPFTVGYIDLYTQLKILGYNENKSEFIDRFCVRGNIAGLLGWQQPIVGYKNIDQLFDLIHQFAITIKSGDVVDLPEQIFVNHPLPMTNEFHLFIQERLKGDEIVAELKKRHLEIDSVYKTISQVNNPFFRNIDYPKLDWIAETNGIFWMRARQLSIGFQGNAEKATWFNRDRLEALKEFLKNNIDNYVLFYNFTPELLEIYDICSELGYNVDIFCGELKSMKYYDEYVSLSDSEKLTHKNNIILANFASGSTGMNWQCYNKCIIFSQPLYKDYEQALKRIHRLGQKETVVYHTFYQKNWLDYSMKSSLEKGVTYSLEMFLSDLERVKSFINNKEE